MQIGYGPDATGRFHPKAVDALEYAGQWLGTNGEAIYETRAMPVHWNDTASSIVRYTRGKDNSTIYAIVLSGFGSVPFKSELALACVQLVPGSHIQLLGYEDEMTRLPLTVNWAERGGMVSIEVPTDMEKHSAIMKPGFVFKLRGSLDIVHGLSLMPALVQ